jgi:hypothetical protein
MDRVTDTGRHVGRVWVADSCMQAGPAMYGRVSESTRSGQHQKITRSCYSRNAVKFTLCTHFGKGTLLWID